MEKSHANVAAPIPRSKPPEPINQRHTKEADQTGGRDLNPYLYENLVSNFEGQIDHWERQAACLRDGGLATSYRLKVEGLKYALRLLDTFAEEFRELTDCALNHAPRGKSQTLTVHALVDARRASRRRRQASEWTRQRRAAGGRGAVSVGRARLAPGRRAVPLQSFLRPRHH